MPAPMRCHHFLLCLWFIEVKAKSATCNHRGGVENDSTVLLQAPCSTTTVPEVGIYEDFPVCGNYMGPDYCNGKDPQHESTCFPRKCEEDPYSDRVSPADCADDCARQHDYCCHNRDGECDGCQFSSSTSYNCRLSPWADDCNTGLANCVKKCMDSGDFRSTQAFNKCGKCWLDAVYELYSKNPSPKKSCTSLSKMALLDAQIKFANCGSGTEGKKAIPWTIRFANFHTHPVKIVMGSKQGGCSTKKTWWAEWKKRTGEDHVVLPPGQTMGSLTDPVFAPVQEMIKYQDRCEYTVENADNGGLLMKVKVDWDKGDTVGDFYIGPKCTSTKSHSGSKQHVGVYNEDGGAAGNGGGCLVCLCSDSNECSKHCADGGITKGDPSLAQVA